MHITLPDLINPIEGLIAGLFHDLERITWSRDYHVAGYDMERLLRQRGIRVYGRITNDPAILGFLVRKTQAKWATYIVNARLAGRPLPPAWNVQRASHAHTAIDWIVDFLAILFGGA